MQPLRPKEPDQFDKALALAKVLLDEQRSSLENNYHRFVWVVSTFAILVGGLGAWVGFKTRSDVNQMVRDQVKLEVSADVQQEVAKQFETKNVQNTVEGILTKEVQTDLDRMVKDRVGPIISNQLVSLQPEIRQETRRYAEQILVDLRPELENLAKKSAIEIVKQQRVARHITPSQRSAMMRASMHIGKTWYIRLRIRSSSVEAQAFANELGLALDYADWLVMRSGVETPGMFSREEDDNYGLVLTTDDLKNPPPHTLELQKTLKAAGFDVPIVKGVEEPMPNGDGKGWTRIPNLVVGEKPPA